MEHSVTDLDALVREEKRLTAVESHSEAWAEGSRPASSPKSSPRQRLPRRSASSCAATAKPAALALIERMRDRVIAGDFAPSRLRALTRAADRLFIVRCSLGNRRRLAFAGERVMRACESE